MNQSKVDFTLRFKQAIHNRNLIMSSSYNKMKSLQMEKENLRDANKQKQKQLDKLSNNRSTAKKSKVLIDLEDEISKNKNRISVISRLIQGKLLYWLTLTHLFT